MTARARTQSPNAISLLTADHKEVQKAFADFAKLKARGSKRGKADIVKRTCLNLTIHAMIEEEIFYPVVRKAIEDDDLMDEATVEHAGAKDLSRSSNRRSQETTCTTPSSRSSGRASSITLRKNKMRCSQR